MPNARVIPIDGDDRGPDRRRRGGESALPVDEADVFLSPDEYGDEGVGFAERVSDALAFLRRRITGEYFVDDFGFDPELTDRVLLAPARPLYSGTSGWRPVVWRTCPTAVVRWWWPTIPARSRWTP